LTLLAGHAMDECACAGFCGGALAWYTAPRPGREGPNEDGLLFLELDGVGVLALADGAGGEAAGDRASAAALSALARELEARGTRTLRETILSGFEAADGSVREIGVGAATTLVAAEIEDRTVRVYHVGDSLTLAVGQRGKRKLETIAHSPTGYAVEAGILDETEALHHAERHLVSNMVGYGHMRVEMTARVPLAQRDTVLLASDGLSDNLHVGEMVEIVRKGPLEKAAATLARIAAERMAEPREGRPSKPDDLTFLIFRPTG